MIEQQALKTFIFVANYVVVSMIITAINACYTVLGIWLGNLQVKVPKVLKIVILHWLGPIVGVKNKSNKKESHSQLEQKRIEKELFKWTLDKNSKAEIKSAVKNKNDGKKMEVSRESAIKQDDQIQVSQNKNKVSPKESQAGPIQNLGSTLTKQNNCNDSVERIAVDPEESTTTSISNSSSGNEKSSEIESCKVNESLKEVTSVREQTDTRKSVEAEGSEQKYSRSLEYLALLQFMNAEEVKRKATWKEIEMVANRFVSLGFLISSILIFFLCLTPYIS